MSRIYYLTCYFSGRGMFDSWRSILDCGLHPSVPSSFYPFTLSNAYLAYNLTSWGYQYCMVNAADGSCGGMLNRLLFHLLPEQYPAASIYAHFPFMTPDFMHPCIASRSADLTYYDFARPGDNDHELSKLYRRRILRLTKGFETAPSEVSTESERGRWMYADD